LPHLVKREIGGAMYLARLRERTLKAKMILVKFT
jgi:hypothetical protein